MISRQSALVFMNNVLAALLGYVAMFFVIRYMGKEALGIVAFGISFAGLFSFLANLGFDSAHTKRISEGKDLGKCNGTYFSIKLLLIGLFLFVVFLSLYIWKNIMGNGFESPLHEEAVYISSIYWAFFSLLMGFMATFNGRKEIAKSQTIRFFNDISRSTMMIIVALSFAGVLALAGAYLAGTLIALLVALYLFKSLPISRPDREYARFYTKFALPLAIASSMLVVASNTDVVMIQWFWNSADVADYYASKKIAMILTMISMAVSTALYPALSSHYAKGEVDIIKEKTVTAERYLSIFMFPVAFFILVFPENIIVIMLSRAMLTSVPTLRALTLLYALIVLNYPYNNLVAAMDRTPIIGKINIVRALLNIGLNLVFIPVSFMGMTMLGMGAFGAAIATFIAFLVTTISLRFAAYGLAGVVVDSRIFKHIIAGLLTSIIFYAIDTSWAVRWYSLLLLALLFVSVYFAILVVMKEFTKKDFDMLIDAIHPGKMAKYVNGELRGKE